jgi:PAS domain S-box-containing protein
VWLLEDSRLEANLVVGQLPEHEVRWFGDGAELLDTLVHQPIPDVLVLDWELPTVSGIEVCAFVRRLHDRLALPIVMLTQHRDEASIVRAFTAGANDYIAKPFVPAELAARVRAAVEARRMHTTLLDTLGRLEREQALLAESEAKYRRLAQSGVIGIIEADLSGRITDANDTFLSIIGRTRAELVSGGLVPRLDSSPLDERALRELLETGVTTPYEKELVRGDGAPVVVGFAATRIGPHSDRCVGYVLDVTEQRQIEADRARLFEAERRARAEAELASRMKDEFLAIVSHELRTPLNAVLGWASILREQLSPTPQTTKALDVIQRNARLQAKVIDDILDVSRIVSGKVRLEPRRVRLESIIDDVVEATRPAASAKGITLTRTLAPDLPPLQLDPDRIHQVVWNLLTNAVKFTDRGGEVRVSTRVQHAHAVLEVTDTGVGIRPEHLLTIFERFRQVDASTTRSHAGLGLGLAIVRHLVEQHGGTVRATSAGLGHGATMTVRLPLPATPHDDAPPAARRPEPAAVAAPVAPSSHASAPAPVSLPSLAGTVAVIVDDDDDSLAYAAATLRKAGAVVFECPTVDVALDAVATHRPNVIISDIAMPTEDGFSLARRVRGLAPREGSDPPCIIALTAHAREDDVQRCRDAGFDHHLAKPVESAELVRCVARCRATWRRPPLDSDR